MRLAFLLALVFVAARAQAATTRLAATLFGETVGEVRLTYELDAHPASITYRSNLLVVRGGVRLRQRAFISTTFERDGGDGTPRILETRARRCTAPDGSTQAPTCTKERRLKGTRGALPSLAAESVLAAIRSPKNTCVTVIDEESGREGKACATARVLASGDTELTGHKFDTAFRAVVTPTGELRTLTLPVQGAHFAVASGPVEVSDADLFADAIPSSGPVREAIREGKLRVRVRASSKALAALQEVVAVGQQIVSAEKGALIVDVTRAPPPRTAATRKILDHAALLVAKARGGHVDCQTAAAWFIDRARARGWEVRPAVGFAYVDGRFAFHAWAVVRTPDGDVPVDPLLAQVPADAGHVQLASEGTSAGELLVAFRQQLELEVE